MAVHLKFNSESAEKTSSRKLVTRIYYAESAAELESFIRQNFAEGSVSEIGKITRNRFFRKGPVWHCEITGEQQYGEDGIVITMPDEPETPAAQKHSLRTVVIPLLLSQLPKYRTYWDHYLWRQDKLNTSNGTTGGEYMERTNTIPFNDRNGNLCCWTKDPSNVALDPPAENCKWQMISTPFKKGISTVEHLTYQITEYGEYNTESAASWAVSSKLNTLRDKPPLGDMGVKGYGTWKLDSASIQYNGVRWVSSCVWTLRNWDEDLYM